MSSLLCRDADEMQGSSGPRDAPLMCDGVILPYSKSSEARVAAIASGVKLPNAGPKRTEGVLNKSACAV